MIFAFVVLAVLIGTLMPIQAALNAELTRYLKHPYLGAFLSLAIGSVIVFFLSLFQGGVSELKRLPEVPPHLLLGGVFGTVFVGSALFFIPRMGATAMIGSFITGQLICSVIIDHYGLWGIQGQPLNPSRIVGVILLFAGLLLVVRKGA